MAKGAPHEDQGLCHLPGEVRVSKDPCASPEGGAEGEQETDIPAVQALKISMCGSKQEESRFQGRTLNPSRRVGLTRYGPWISSQTSCSMVRGLARLPLLIFAFYGK